MKSLIRNFIISLVSFILLFLAACNAAPQTAPTITKASSTKTAAQVSTSTNTVVDTATLVPTKKASKTPTPDPVADESLAPENQLTATLEATSTATATPVKIADWRSAKYYTGGALAHWQYFIALEFDGNITGEYYAVVDKNKDYKCTVLPMYPNRLYCDGPQAAFMDYVDFVVYDAKTDQQVFKDRIWIPATYYSEYTN